MKYNAMQNANEALEEAFHTKDGDFIDESDLAKLSESEFINFKKLINSMRECLNDLVGSADYDDIEEFINKIQAQRK